MPFFGSPCLWRAAPSERRHLLTIALDEKCCRFVGQWRLFGVRLASRRTRKGGCRHGIIFGPAVVQLRVELARAPR
jgi:hypothetical protein